MARKFALVLSGGGFKGAFQVGALEYIFQTPITIDGNQVHINKFDIVTGISVGSLNGAMIATNQFGTLKKLWFDEIAENGPGIVYKSKYMTNGEPNIKSIVNDLVPSLNVFRKIALLFSKRKREKFITAIFKNIKGLKSLADISPLLTTLNKHISINKFNTLFKMGYVSLVDGKYKVHKATDFNVDNELNKAIMASSAMPIIWEPVPEIKTSNGTTDLHSVDGGIRNISPLKDAIDEINADASNPEYYVIIINCTNRTLEPMEKDMNILSIASRSLLEITLGEIFENDIEEFLFVNKILKQLGQSSINIDGKNYKSFRVKVIQPPDGVSLGDTLDTAKATILDRHKRGFDAAKMAFEGVAASNWNV